MVRSLRLIAISIAIPVLSVLLAHAFLLPRMVVLISRESPIPGAFLITVLTISPVVARTTISTSEQRTNNQSISELAAHHA